MDAASDAVELAIYDVADVAVAERLQGEVLPGGGDYQRVGGSTKLDARYTLAASDAEGPCAFLNENAFLSSDPGSAAGGVSITTTNGSELSPPRRVG